MALAMPSRARKKRGFSPRGMHAYCLKLIYETSSMYSFASLPCPLFLSFAALQVAKKVEAMLLDVHTHPDEFNALALQP